MKENISVIIPTYNRGEYLKESIESVLKQSVPVSEIIVIDDGSTDNTKEMVQNFNSQNIKYLYQENNGPGSARNKGLNLAKGNFIAFQDSDDIWIKDKIGMQIDFFKKFKDIDLVFGNMVNFGSSFIDNLPEILNYKVYCYFKKNYQFSEQALEYLLIENIIPTSSVMFKSDCLKKVSSFKENLFCSEDYDFWLRMAYFFKMGFIDEILVKRRIHDSNIISNSQERNISRLYVLEDFKINYPNLLKTAQKNLEDSINEIKYKIGSYYFKQNEFKKSIDYLKKVSHIYMFNVKYLFKFMFCLIYLVCSKNTKNS